MIKGALILGSGLAIGFGAGWLNGLSFGFSLRNSVETVADKTVETIVGPSTLQRIPGRTA